MLKSIILGASVFALTAAPIAASAATANPASKLSLSSATRAGTPAGKSNRLAGSGIGPIAAGAILVGIAAAAVLLISDKEDDDSDSN
ncbi:hypothetical protein M0208_06735 [Sphingomonas sp. SUN019]|uniref:hypothetical protein n=1 Tax=Sphingomonas sp. SUN019 TaxID=2937788 RepID=UPI0021644711|nr:hypothetical protein [Sphingomonas sp. SUN019]UVO50231.1 hypothetical protein M0208_06735 [Sphingomonas sp. SUN019]